MAFIALPNGVSCVVGYGFVGQPAISNGFYFTLPGFTPADMQDLADAMGAWFVVNVLPELSNVIEYKDTVVTDQTAPGGAQAISTVGAGTTGAGVGQCDDLATSMVVTHRTNRIGRAFRGRSYIRGFDAGDLGSNLWDAAVVTAIEAAFDLVQGQAGWTWVLRTTKVDGVPQLPALATAIALSVVRNAIVGHQRRSVSRP